MARAQNRLSLRRQAAATLDEAMRESRLLLVIHYSCESFYDLKDGRSPRITSIAVRSPRNHQTQSFSIHQAAERQEVKAAQISRHYDPLERAMLSEFFAYVAEHRGYRWVHWNMRDMNYGFPALEHRYRVLGGTPVTIPEESRIDLAALLIEIHGSGYAPHPRLASLLNINKISAVGFLNGAEEAQAFESGEYVKLHQSTLRKVDVLGTILHRAWDGTLKTNVRWYEYYGVSVAGFVDGVTDHWAYKLLGFLAIVATLIGLYVTVR